MKNLLFRLLCLVLALNICACGAKMTLKPTAQLGSKPKVGLCDRRIGILVLEDKRTDKYFDRLLKETSEEYFSQAVVDRFRENCPDSVKLIKREPDAIDADNIRTLYKKENVDFLLMGALKEFDSDFYDDFYWLRVAGWVAAGVTFPVGLVIYPLTLIGSEEQITKVTVDDLHLVDMNMAQIVWRGRVGIEENEKIQVIEVGLHRRVSRLMTKMDEATNAIFAGVSSAYDAQFPNKLTKEKTIAVLNHQVVPVGAKGTGL